MGHIFKKKAAAGGTLGHWAKKTLCGSAALGLAMAMAMQPVSAGHGNQHRHGNDGFETMTPFSRVAKLPIVEYENGDINYEATYAKARAASVALATYVARMKEADMLGSDVIAGIDWKLGGTSAECLETRVCDDHEIDEAVLAIPSPERINPTLPASKTNTKKANVLDFCNKKYASLAMGVEPITGSKADGTGKYVVNGYSHAPALPCEVSIWNDDEHIYVDMLDPSAIFSLFFSDVLFSEEMQDADFAAAMNAMPSQVKDEIKAIIYAALSEFDPKMKAMDQKIGPKYKSLEDIVEVVDAAPYDSPYKHMSYTKADGGVFTEAESKAVAQEIIDTLSTHTNSPGVHPTVINADGDTLDSILSPNSSWRSARLEPISIPGKNHIIEACSPYYAKMAMGTGIHHVNALPCEITVKIIDGGNKLVVSYLDPAFMLGALFADISEEEKEAFGEIPNLIMEDLQAIVWAALTINSGIEMNEPVQISYDMLP